MKEFSFRSKEGTNTNTDDHSSVERRLICTEAQEPEV